MFTRIADFSLKKRPPAPKPLTPVRYYVDSPVLSNGEKWYPVVKFTGHNNPIIPNHKVLEYFKTRKEAENYLKELENDE